MLVTDSADLAERARYLATQARDPFPHYEHSTLGYNYRLSNLLAALGRAQLRGLDSRIDRRRRDPRALPRGARRPAGDRVHAGGRLRGAQLAGSPASRWTPRRSAPTASRSGSHSRRSTSSRGPPGSRCISSRCSQGRRPSAGRCVAGIFERGLCLPTGSALTESEIDRVVETLDEDQRKVAYQTEQFPEIKQEMRIRESVSSRACKQ